MSRSAFPVEVVNTVLAKTGGLCTYCGTRIGWDVTWRWALDHMLPVARGGNDDIENLIGACGFCNSAKSNRTVDEYRLIVMTQQGRIFTQAQKDFWLASGIDLSVAEPIRFVHE